VAYLVEEAVARVIATMRDKLGEQLTIDDMARSAMFSKFHFSRIFQRVTGVSPGRFLSALRLQEAKQLLVSTQLNVTDISLRVGYNSVGTFSSRFTRSVGLSPTTYRRLGGFTSEIPADGHRWGPGQASGTVRGRIYPSPTNPPGLVYVGLFPGRIPEGRPARCTILERPGPYVLEHVPEGVWYALSHSIASDPDHAIGLATDRDTPVPFVGSCGPLTIRRDTVLNGVDLRLRPMRPIDPPVLLALLDVRKARRSVPAMIQDIAA